MFKILDCTLRDGGYINNWEFGEDNIKNYLEYILRTNVNYVEAGFLVEKPVNINQSLYNNVSEITFNSDKITLMMAYGKYKASNLPHSSLSLVKNIRYIFKHQEIEPALIEVNIVKEKGYNLFINPTFISTYDNKEIFDLTKKINLIRPFCYTIVDSMGVLDKKRFIRIFNLFNDNLCDDIAIGIHLHDNLNYINENINALLNIKTKRTVILDATLTGIGRGAGNPVLEDYIKINKNTNLYLKNALDKFLSVNKQKYKLAALNNCHPCYASYLIKNNIEDKITSSIFQNIPLEFKTNYNRSVIEKIVSEYI